MAIRAKIKALSSRIVSLLPIVGLAASLAAADGDFRLVQAAKNKDKEAVRVLVKQHVDVNAPRGDGSTALAWAAHWDDMDVADLLIAAGANVNAASDSGDTPLWEACNNASPAMVKKLLKAGANPNLTPPGIGETALMRCARAGNADAVRSLLGSGAEVNAKEPARGQTALMWALSEGNSEAVKALLEHGADVHAKSKGGFTPLLFAARQGDIDSARLLLDAGADMAESAPGGMNALLVATDSGHEQFAIFLLERGANPNSSDRDGLTALHYAIRKGFIYLKAARRLDAYNDMTLSYMFRPNMPDLVKALLDHGANPNARIAKGGRKSRFEGSSDDFLKMGVAGATPFLLAAASGDVGLMRILLAKDADPKLATNDGVTPLMAASGVGLAEDRTKEEEKGALEAVKMLVEMGADVNAAGGGWALTALHGAAYIGADDIIRYLVGKGARLDTKDEMGQTPLSIAEGDLNGLSEDHERRYHPETAKLIRELGGDPLANFPGKPSSGDGASR